MKKLFFYFTIILFGLTSCNIDADITYHKDGNQSMLMNVDMKELFEIIKSDSTLTNDEKNKEFLTYPKEWTSLYDIFYLKEGKIPKDTDSTQIMRKIFIKQNFTDNEPVGISFKTDKINKKDLEFLGKRRQDSRLFISREWNWDGKTLKIHLNNFENISENTKQKLLLFKTVKQRIHFETPIKSIKGKHDWIKKIDHKTVEINIDLQNKKTLKNKDSGIIITTK